MRYRFTLTGKTPMLMHNDDVEAADRLSAWRKDPSNKGVSSAGDDRSPAWTWQTYLYTDGEHVVVPSCNLSVCLRQAGSQVIMKKQKTFKEASQSGMFITDEFLRFECGNPFRQLTADSVAIATADFATHADAARKLGFRLFVKRAKVGTSKHIRVRPRFDQWRITGELLTNAPELTESVVRQLFEIAGRVGLGDWRPGCKTPGPFGMFGAEVERLT